MCSCSQPKRHQEISRLLRFRFARFKSEGAYIGVKCVHVITFLRLLVSCGQNIIKSCRIFCVIVDVIGASAACVTERLKSSWPSVTA